MAKSRLSAACLVLWLAISVACSAQAPRYGAWDRFFYKVQTPLETAAPSARVTLLVYHSYSGPLHQVRAVGSSDALVVARQPAPLAALDPTEISRLTFQVQPKSAVKTDRATLRITLEAEELPETKAIAVTVPLTAQAAAEVNDSMRLPVGTMEVRVGGLGNQVYLLYLVPMLGLIGWLLWRRKRLAAL
jgi:hypothetical protein